MTNPHTEITKAIRKRLDDNKSALGLPILYANLDKEFLRMVGGAMPDEFIELDVIFGNGDQVSIGSINNRKHRYVGVIMFNIFTPLGMGEGRAMQINDIIAGIFRSRTFDGITCRVPSPNSGRKIMHEKGNYWTITTSCPFYADYNL